MSDGGALRQAAALRFFLVMPVNVPAAKAAACLEAFCERADAASLLLPAEEGVDEAFLREMTRLAQARGLAVLVANDAALMQQLGADGVHLVCDDARQVADLRRRLGADAIIGACCPRQRHVAMELGEAGADYLGIDQRVEARGENLLAWWAEMFTVPVVAMHPAAAADLGGLARLGADFAVPLADMWRDADAAAALADSCEAALRQIAQGRAGKHHTG